MNSTDLDTPGQDRPALPPPAPAYVRPPKSPGFALLLSVFPGLGQVYNGQPAKALVFFFSWAGSIYLIVESNAVPFALLTPFIYFYNLIDAYRSAALINERSAGKATAAEEDAAESPAWGVTLIGLGLLLLANNMGWLDLARLQRYWPVLLIAAGIFLLWGSIQKRNQGSDVGRL